MRARLSPVTFLIFSAFVALYFLAFYRIIDPDYYRDLSAYSSAIDVLAQVPFSRSDFSIEGYAHRVSTWGEYLSYLLLQLAGHAGLDGTDFHILTLVCLFITVFYAYRLRSTIENNILVLSYLLPAYVFSNLLMGNTRQILAEILILTLYERQKQMVRFAPRWRQNLTIVVCYGLLFNVHVGSVFVLAFLQVVDFVASPRRALRTLGKRPILLLAVAAVTVTLAVAARTELAGKVETYLFAGIYSPYPYLTGAFTYFSLVPSLVDGYVNRRAHGESFSPFFRAQVALALMITGSTLIGGNQGVDRLVMGTAFILAMRRLPLGHLSTVRTAAGLRLASLFIYVPFRAS